MLRKIFLILRKILFVLILIIIFKIVYFIYIHSYQWTTNYINKYNEELNIKMNRKNIKITYHLDTGGNTGHSIEWIRTKKLKNDRISKTTYDTWYEDEIPLDIHLVGEYDYVGEKLVYDKSKGNHFEKIEKYLEKYREEIFKGVLEQYWEEGIRIKFYTTILHKIADNKYILRNHIFEIKDNDILRVDNKDFDFDSFYNARKLKEKEFFKTKIKYEDIDWGKYIEYMEDYPVLIMKIDEKVKNEGRFKVSSEEDYWLGSFEFSIFDSDREFYDYEIRRQNVLKKVYKDIEKFYNKDTFTFVIGY